jgi:hypothetical protein
MLPENFVGPYLLAGAALAGQKRKCHEKTKLAKIKSRSTFRLDEGMHRAVFGQIISVVEYRVSTDYCLCRNQRSPSIEFTLPSGRQLSTTGAFVVENRSRTPIYMIFENLWVPQL